MIAVVKVEISNRSSLPQTHSVNSFLWIKLNNKIFIYNIDSDYRILLMDNIIETTPARFCTDLYF